MPTQIGICSQNQAHQDEFTMREKNVDPFGLFFMMEDLGIGADMT